MASLDTFEITLTGRSFHAAMPETGDDPLIAAAHLLLALQTITARHISPTDSTVLSVTQINGGVALNVIPDDAVLCGIFRCLQTPVRDRVKTLISDLVAALPPSFGVSGEVTFSVGYPVTHNHAADGIGRLCFYARGMSGRLLLAGSRRRNALPSPAQRQL